MADELRRLTDAELGRALTDLGHSLSFPELDVAAAVRSHIEGDHAAGRSRTGRLLPWRARSVRRGVVLAAAALLLLAGAAVAVRLGLRGVEIVVQESPSIPPTSAGADLFLGRRVTLEEARGALSFPVLVPTLEGLESPDEVYVSSVPRGGRVSLVYRAERGLPATAETGVGILLSEFRGRAEREFISKVVDGGATVEAVTVGGAPGFWITGEHHFLHYRDDEGRIFVDAIRAAGNTLLWEAGDLTLRLESALSKEEAIRIAESVR